MQVNMHDAKTRLSKLVQAALDGEEVVIARNGKPVARITRYAPARSWRWRQSASLRWISEG